MKNDKIVIFGSSEIATEMALFYFTHDSPYTVVAFTVDDKYVDKDKIKSLPLVPFSKVKKLYPPHTYDMHVCVGYSRLNLLRLEKYAQARIAGYKLVSYVSSKAITWPDLTIGDNCFILEQNNIQPTVKIGNNVMLWSGNHIGHETVIHDHVYLASHVCISGYNIIGDRTFIGVNATTRDFCQIGAECFITMGALITAKKIESGSVVFGPRCTILKPGDWKATKIKKKYFGLY
ncbi:MAG: acetyltransferase [Patescibacteria group bacterium]